MQPYTIIFVGPQGSGKGTQIDLLTKVFEKVDPEREVVDIQTGRRFRALAAKREGFTEQRLAETVEAGVLQPLFLSVVLWGDAFHHHVDPDCHLLIDGFPRTVDEARVLESALTFYKRSPLTIVNLETSEDIVRVRMVNRARPDDTPDSIGERLRWYREETLPVLAYYRERPHTTIIECDGTQTIKGVQHEIQKQLGIG